jgi:hypothetical protein
MKTLITGLLILTTLVIIGGCSSSAPDVSAALAPAADASGSSTRNASALSWGSPIVVDDEPGGSPRPGISTAIIDGNPAVSYANWTSQGRSAKSSVYYARANDPAGTSWGRPVEVASWPDQLSPPRDWEHAYTSLFEVNGRPAIAYMDGTDPKARDMCYVRANDSTGKKWGTPVIADGNGDTGLAATMNVINGNPAIVYKDYLTTSYYVRSLDPNGDTWGTPIPLSTYQIVIHTLEIVNGHPAVCYGLGNQLIYSRATDMNGDDWSNPVNTQIYGFGSGARLAVVGGHPAIAVQSDSGGLLFSRALDADGTTWPAEAVLVSDGSSLDIIGSLADIGGLPSIAFGRGAPDVNPSPFTLNFVQATDAAGSGWETPGTLADLGTIKRNVPCPQLAELGSGAGIAFTDEWNTVNFIGTLPAPPDPAVNVQLSTDKSAYIIGQDTSALLTAVVTAEYGDPIGGLGAGAFATTLDGGGVVVTFSESATAGTYTGNLDISGFNSPDDVGDHTVQTTVTDTRDIKGSDSATFTMSEPGAGGTMHVGDLDASADPGPHNWWRATFTVKIDDSIEDPVGSADVAFSLSGVENGSGQVTTGSDGTAAYQTGWIKNSGDLTFTVDDVTHATLSYSAGDNHDPDGDSDGTSITISGP